MSEWRPCIVIPTYDNPRTIRPVVEKARSYLGDVIVVDDGSSAEAASICEALERDGLAKVVRHAENRGKGAAVKTGMARARELGFTHALQVDGDGQHALERIPSFLERSKQHQDALILGYPLYDDTLHRGRYAARLVTRFWNYIEVLGPRIADSMCGFRVYPIGAAIESGTRGDRMDFDIEIPVRMAWNGVPIVNEPVEVRYLTADEGGVSHYRTLVDTAFISMTHARLVVEGAAMLLSWPFRKLLRRS